MVEIIIGLLVIHFTICLVLAVLDLYFGYSSGQTIDFNFILDTLIGAFLWPIGLAALYGMNLYNYFRKK